MRLAWAALAAVAIAVSCCAGLPLVASMLGALTASALVGPFAGLAILALAVALTTRRRRATARAPR